MEDVHADETGEARRLLAAAFDSVPAGPVTAGDGLLRAVRRRSRAVAEPALSRRRPEPWWRPGPLPRCCCL